MNNATYILIFCIICHYVRSHQPSETFQDINYEEDEQDHDANEERDDENNERDDEENYEVQKLKLDAQDEEMEKAREAGDAADLFGTNQHYNIPVNYPDFGRRFVLTYPYVEKKIKNDAAEAELDKSAKRLIENDKGNNKELTPVKAPPEFVLEIAKKSAILEATKPKNPTDEIVQKDILRTGEYWDDVWKEDVDVKKMSLRSRNNQNKLDSITVNISPGSRLHTLISMLKQKSPRLLYVINKNTDRYSVV